MRTKRFPEHGRTQGDTWCPSPGPVSQEQLALGCGMASPAPGNAQQSRSLPGLSCCGHCHGQPSSSSSTPGHLGSLSWDTGRGDLQTRSTSLHCTAQGPLEQRERQWRERLAWHQLQGSELGACSGLLPQPPPPHTAGLGLSHSLCQEKTNNGLWDLHGESRAQQTCSEQAGVTGTAVQVKHYLLKD